MTEQTLSYQQSIQLLKTIVNNSNIKNQKFVDFSLVQAYDREKYQKAMMFVQGYVARGEKTEEQLKTDLGLI